MQLCVIYARVSTKEQQAEGYSIPAQLKAIRAFCAAENLSPVAEFVEAESAGCAGRTQFGRMLDFLKAHPDVHTVVAHKLDRLYRNFSDQVALEEDFDVHARYVEGDVPDTPQGELLRDVQLSVAKYYLSNLREEVIKGMDEKVAQGGWPHRAPMGYRNDKEARTVVPDASTAPMVAWAFERYGSGAVALSGLADELYARGLCSSKGTRLSVSVVHKMLSNPFYVGRISHKGAVYPGVHAPLVSVGLFEAVQQRLAGNANGTKKRKATYPLRGVMHCAECGCLITAGTHKGHVYYRCTHGKGKDSCTQRSYVREEVLMEQVEALLAGVEVGPEAIEQLLAETERYLAEQHAELEQGRAAITRQVDTLKAREKKLLDSYLDGAVPVEIYQEKAAELASERRGLELRVAEYGEDSLRSYEQVRELLATSASARVDFSRAEGSARREVVDTVLCNLTLEDGLIASYQYKDPFGLLEMESSGAFKNSWWAIQDLNL